MPSVQTLERYTGTVSFGQLQWVALVVGWIPALLFGYVVGLWTSQIGSPANVVSLIERGFYFAIPPLLLARLTPRAWIIPAILYGLSFHCGYTQKDQFVYALTGLFRGLAAQLGGTDRAALPVPSWPELPWFYLSAAAVATVASLWRVNNVCGDVARKTEGPVT